MHRQNKSMTIMMASAIMITWPISVAVSTPPSHGGDSGSSPGSATKTNTR